MTEYVVLIQFRSLTLLPGHLHDLVHGRQLVHRVGQRLVIHDGADGEDVLLAAFVVLDYPGKVVDQELHQGLDVHDVQSGRV